MKPKNNISAKQVRRLLHYNKTTGLFHWNEGRRGRFARPGALAGGNGDGYWYIGINCRKFLASRLAWLYVTGHWPRCLIDHKNGNTLDNRWCNLRQATHSQNLCNSRARRGGLKGTTRSRERWCAQITVKSRRIYLGVFKTRNEAHQAYVQAAKRFHGKFYKAG